MLQHLHPQLQLPTLEQDAEPPAQGFGAAPWSAARRRYAIDRCVCIGGRCRVVQKAARTASAPLLPAKRKAEDDSPAGAAATEEGANPPAAGGAAAADRQHRLRAVQRAADTILGLQPEADDHADGRRSEVAASSAGPGPPLLGTLPELLAAVRGLR